MDPAEKEAALKELIARAPGDETLRFGLAQHYAQASRPADAAGRFREAIALKPEFTAAYLGLGKALAKAGDAAGARKAFEEGLAVAERTGDEMTAKAMRSLLNQLGP